MAIFQRRLPPIPEPDASLRTHREEIRGDRRQGWPRELQRVRLALPNHLHGSPPPRNRGNGLWAVIALADRVPVGLAWSVGSPGTYDTALIEEVAVVSEWRRCGVGTRLIRESAAWMADLGYGRLVSKPITPAASTMLHKLGFRDDGYGMHLARCERVAGR